MLDLNTVNLAKEEYEEKLKRAALYRRVTKRSSSQTSFVESALLGISQFLIDAGERLRQRVEVRPI